MCWLLLHFIYIYIYISYHQSCALHLAFLNSQKHCLHWMLPVITLHTWGWSTPSTSRSALGKYFIFMSLKFFQTIFVQGSNDLTCSITTISYKAYSRFHFHSLCVGIKRCFSLCVLCFPLFLYAISRVWACLVSVFSAGRFCCTAGWANFLIKA